MGVFFLNFIFKLFLLYQVWIWSEEFPSQTRKVRAVSHLWITFKGGQPLLLTGDP